MATVRMRKGDKYADIFDSPETIKQAQLDGYSIAEKAKEAPKAEPVKTDAPKAAAVEKKNTESVKPAQKQVKR